MQIKKRPMLDAVVAVDMAIRRSKMYNEKGENKMKVIDSFSGEFEFLSNFFLCEIEMDGKNFPSVEHAYQAAKTFDKTQQEAIRCAKTPSEAKRLGRKVLLRDDWETVKFSIMEDLLRKKFAIPEFKKALLTTDGIELIEGNWWNDQVWGICNGVGKNHLGKLLMKIREELKYK